MNSILIIDSSEANAEIMSRFLTSNGFDVTTMSDGTGVGVKIKVSPPDLIIIDTDLATSSGYDICKKIRDDDSDRFTPILMMSAIETAHSQTRAISAGADDFMCKNIEASVLLSKIKSLLRIKNLSDQLKNQYMELADKNKQLDIQLKMAREVQRSLIKEHNFVHNSAHFVSRYLPALDIGGDFYDIVILDEDCIGVAIGDVSGHGISAALLTAMLNMMVRNLAPKYFYPAQFLFHMNNEFASIFENTDNEMYVCLFYAVINTKKKRIYYSNAGQALPLHIKAGQGVVDEFESYGMPIGMMKDSVYEHRIALFDDGDLVLFYTDGLMDNLYKENEEEFYDRIKTLLLEVDVNLLPEEIIETLLGVFHSDDIASSKKYELDDVSVIMCKI